MWDRIKELLNPKKFLDGIIISKVAAKAIKFGTAAVLGLLAGPKVAPFLVSAKPILDEMGIDPQKVAMVGVAALVGAVINYAKRRWEVAGE